MINASEIIDAVKVLLDADSTLNAALGTQPEDSKVFIRNTIPEQSSPPFILISDALLEPPLGHGRREPIKDQDTVAFDVIVHAKNRADGSEDRSTIYSIAMAADNVLNGAYGTLTSCKYHGMQRIRADAIETLTNMARKLLAYNCKGVAI